MYTSSGNLPANSGERFMSWGCESEIHSVVSDSLWPHGIRFMEFSRPEYWNGSPFPSPGHLPNPEIELRSQALQVDCLLSEPTGKPLKKDFPKPLFVYLPHSHLLVFMFLLQSISYTVYSNPINHSLPLIKY